MNALCYAFSSLLIATLLAACNGGPASVPVSTAPPATMQPAPTIAVTITQSSATEVTETAGPSASTAADPAAQEAILILQPGPGSRLTSPLVVQGEADSTFEQNLGVQLLLPDGTVLSQGNAQIQAEMGQRGPFTVEIPFSISSEQQAFVQVFSSSARDGGILHLASSGVTLLPAGEPAINEAGSRSEQISILEPAPGAQIAGGAAHIEGWGWASFEQTLVIELLDASGDVIGSQPVTVQSAEMGRPGPFQADISYMIDSEIPGRVVIRDISPAFGGDSHRTSVEVMLAP